MLDKIVYWLVTNLCVMNFLSLVTLTVLLLDSELSGLETSGISSNRKTKKRTFEVGVDLYKEKKSKKKKKNLKKNSLAFFSSLSFLDFQTFCKTYKLFLGG